MTAGTPQIDPLSVPCAACLAAPGKRCYSTVPVRKIRAALKPKETS